MNVFYLKPCLEHIITHFKTLKKKQCCSDCTINKVSVKEVRYEKGDDQLQKFNKQPEEMVSHCSLEQCFIT